MAENHTALKCCNRMEQLTRECAEHTNRLDCVDTILHRYGDWVGIPIHDGGHSGIEIFYCPWCGRQLPEGS